MKKFLTACLVLAVSAGVWADVAVQRQTIDPIRKVSELIEPSKTEEMVQLADARVVYADYDLLRQDFPELLGLSEMEIDHWLIETAGYISQSQAGQEIVNSSIPLGNRKVTAHRPDQYGRAIIFEAHDPSNPQVSIGLIDAKGVGVKRGVVPSHRSHGDGLVTLGEAIREVAFERLVREILSDAGAPNKTVSSYAVIYPGFDVVHSDGSKSPAGIYLRQAHKRVRDGSHWSSEVNAVLVRYGIDTGYNIQSTPDNNLFDFGHYTVTPFSSLLLDTDRRIPVELWSYVYSITNVVPMWGYSKLDKPWCWSHETADAVAYRLSPEEGKEAIKRHLANLLDPVKTQFSEAREKRSAACKSLFAVQ